jgi:hypothetical protein
MIQQNTLMKIEMRDYKFSEPSSENCLMTKNRKNGIQSHKTTARNMVLKITLCGAHVGDTCMFIYATPRNKEINRQN